MAKPDVAIARWVGPPRSYTSGRKSGQPSVIIIHTTDGSEGSDSAENGAAYDKRRTDGTSTHFFVDSDSILQEVELKDEAHAARQHGNDIGIQIEICGKAGQSANQWADEDSAATLENVARLCVALRRTGNYPLSRLTGQYLREAWTSGSPRGFCGHVDVTYAFPEDKGTHTDPGKAFPWTWLFKRITELEGNVAKKKHTKVDLDDLAISVINYGDDDRDFDGNWMVQRAQRLSGMAVEDQDGRYGNKTVAAIKARIGGTGRQVGLAEWRLLAGLIAG